MPEVDYCTPPVLGAMHPRGQFSGSHAELQLRETKRDWTLYVQDAGSVTTLETPMCFFAKQETCHKLKLRNNKSINFIVVSSLMHISQN